jgi:hypothetical protein
MTLLDLHRASTYLDLASAQRDADRLNRSEAGSSDAWLYEVEPLPNGAYRIAIYEESGELVAVW